MKTWQKLLTELAVGLTAVTALVLPQVGLAVDQPADKYGLKATAGAAEIPTDKNIQTIIGNVIGTALSMISVLFFALMLYAGIKWMLARGDSEEARKALDTIIAAIIGMLVVLGSYAITNFVFGSLGQGGGTSGGSPTSDNGAGGGSVDKTAWIPGVSEKYCGEHYASYGLSCQEKSDCKQDVTGEIVKKITDAYTSQGYGLLGNGSSQIGASTYIANACPGTSVCCL